MTRNPESSRMPFQYVVQLCPTEALRTKQFYASSPLATCCPLSSTRFVKTGPGVSQSVSDCFRNDPVLDEVVAHSVMSGC